MMRSPLPTLLMPLRQVLAGCGPEVLQPGSMTLPGVAGASDKDAKVALLALLRRSTREAHHRIDHHPLLAPLLRPALSWAHYGVVLGTFFDLYHSLQPEIAAALRQCDDGYELADRLAWLDGDLAYLAKRGCVVSADISEWQPPPILCRADLVGTLYVVEGSALGGQVIARCLRVSLGVDCEAGAKFFHGRGEETLHYWNRFQQFAATRCLPEDHERAAIAAVAVFDHISRALDASWTRYSVQALGLDNG